MKSIKRRKSWPKKANYIAVDPVIAGSSHPSWFFSDIPYTTGILYIAKRSDYRIKRAPMLDLRPGEIRKIV